MANKTSVLVTGGCGFLGRHLVLDLLKDGYEVWVIDNLFTGKHPDTWLTGYSKRSKNGHIEYNGKKGRLIFLKKDIVPLLQKELKNPGSARFPKFEEVYHLAALVGGRAVLIEQDPMFVAQNYVIESLFFQWAVRNLNKIGRVLYASSSVAYPKALQNKGTERTLKESDLVFEDSGAVGLPESIYGWLKLAGEYLAVVAARKYGLKVCCVRPFNGFGDVQELSYPIPSIAARAARREDPLTVWGSGNQSRDFIYIDDFVSALRYSIKNVTDGSAVNIGLGKNTTFKEVAAIFAKLEGYSPKIVGLTEKVEGSFTLRSDITRLKSFGWKPTVSVEEGFAKVLKRVKSQLKK
jgi:nucleoside-diphosphate-sugar epimerase